MAKKTFVFTFEEVVFMTRLVQYYPMPAPDVEEGKAWHKMTLLVELLQDTVKTVVDKGNGAQAVEVIMYGWMAKTVANMLKAPYGVSNGQAVPLAWPANQATFVARMLFKLIGETIGIWADEEDDDEILPVTLKEKP